MTRAREATATVRRTETPALYDVWISHSRGEPAHSFRHRSYLWLIDIDAPPVLPRWLAPLARFTPADHAVGEDSGDSLRANLETWLATQGVHLDGGRVLMLTAARHLGFVFNPITVYWCHDTDGEPVCVVAEVHNTYGGRHRYLLRPDAADLARTDKVLYVSPFLTVDGHYRMALPRPDERLAITVTLHQDGRPALAASVRGSRRPAGPLGVLRMALARPLVTHRTWALIHRHGIALWLRRLPVVPRVPGDSRGARPVPSEPCPSSTSTARSPGATDAPSDRRVTDLPGPRTADHQPATPEVRR